MDGIEPVGGIPVMAPPDPMEQLLALEMIRVTEAAAIESARFMGRGDKDGADAAATEAMRRTMDEIDFAGRIVIGEGERDEAPMLYIGERVGRTGADRDDVPRVDIAVDPLEGTNLVAHGQPGAITVLAASEAGGLTHAPDTYMEKLCVGPVAAGHVDIRATPTENLESIARALGRKVADITVVILERPRHDALIAEVKKAGARIKLIGDGDLSAAISCAVSGTGVHAVMGTGGAPEGVITAAALRCLGGEIQARFRYRSDDERERGTRMGHGDEERVYRTEDLAPGENLVFAATGVTDGRPAPGHPLLRWRGADPFAGDGLRGQAGPLRRHGPHVRPRQPATGQALGRRALRLQGIGRAVPAAATAGPGDRGGKGRLRVGLDQRSLPAVAPHRRPRAQRARLAGCRRPGDRAGHARHQRPDAVVPLQPGDRRPGLRHARLPGARPGHPRRRHRGVAQRDPGRHRLARAERAVRAAQGVGDAHPAALPRGLRLVRGRVLPDLQRDDLRQARGARADLHRGVGAGGGAAGGADRGRADLHLGQGRGAVHGHAPPGGRRRERTRPAATRRRSAG